jgi:hypothetical protein
MEGHEDAILQYTVTICHPNAVGKCGMTPASTIDLYPLYLVAVSNIRAQATVWFEYYF